MLDVLPESVWDESMDPMNHGKDDEEFMLGMLNWTENSNITSFNMTSFLLQYNTTNLNMSSVNFTAMNFTGFNLTRWLDSYNLTQKFNDTLALLSNNNNMYDINEFNLTEYIEKGWGIDDTGMMKQMWPMDTFLNETNITSILSFVVVDLATNGTFEVGFFDLLHEVYAGMTPFDWLLMYNITPIAFNMLDSFVQ